MQRSGWTDSGEFELSDAGTEEIENFLKPLSRCYLSHVGWKGFDPVFRVPENLTVTQVRSRIQSLLDDGRIQSAGHTAYIVNSDYDSSEPSPSEFVLVLKVENWMTGCIPNPMHDDKGEKDEYISERESEIASRIKSKIPSDMVVVVNRHVGHGGRYGQYQFLAVKEN